MTFKSRVSITSATTVLGVSLIIFGFFLLIPPDQRSQIAWLDLFTAISLFIVNFSNVFLFSSVKKKFESIIPGIGVFWLADIIYSVLALVVAIAGFQYQLSFEIQLMGQLTALFFLIVVFGWAVISNRQSENVYKNENKIVSNIMQIRQDLDRLEVTFSRLKPDFGMEKKKFLKSKNDFRYISPVENQDAWNMEMDIKNILDNLSRIVSGTSIDGTPSKQDINTALDAFEDTIRLRKKCCNSNQIT